VDDDVQTANLLAALLSDEFDVSVAKDAISGVRAACSTTPPHLLIADVTMPGMDGYAMVEKIRATANGRTLPVIFLTARDRPMDVVRGIQSGARYYLAKPVDVDELTRRCRRILDTSRTSVAPRA
jgi:DNA-binding response OmpR family regulator